MTSLLSKKKKRIQSCLPSSPLKFLNRRCIIFDRNFTSNASYIICVEPKASGASPWENTVQVILEGPVSLRSRIRRAKSIAHANRSSQLAADWLGFQMTTDAKKWWRLPYFNKGLACIFTMESTGERESDCRKKKERKRNQETAAVELQSETLESHRRWWVCMCLMEMVSSLSFLSNCPMEN